MARPSRPASEHIQPVGCSTEAGTEEEDRAPIFSLSKSSMDVLMAVGAPHKRDPAWTRVDLKRSSSTNTHSEQNSLTLQQLHTHILQHVNMGSTHDSLPLDEHCAANAEQWSVSSRSSTPDTAVWRGGTVRPWSLTQEALCSSAPDSPFPKPVSLSTTPSPLVSPLQTPSFVPTNPFSPSLPRSTHRQEDVLMPSSTLSPLPSPLPPPPLSSYSPEVLQLTSTEDESFLEKHSQCFHFPSPIPSSISLKEEGGYGSVSAEPGCLVDGTAERLPSLTFSPGATQSLGAGMEGPADVAAFKSPPPNPPAEESRGGNSLCHLKLPWQPGQSCPTGSSPCQGWRSALVSSLSDSRLDNCCRCNFNHSQLGITALMSSPRAPKGEVLRDKGAVMSEEGTMTSQLELVDAAVQTVSPAGSWWNLRRNMSYMSSNMDSHSNLGSPPGSRLNLRSSLGSNSNLVSLSSSIFPLDSGEEEGQGDDYVCAISSPLSHPMERRRSCLKVQGEDRQRSGERDELGRRSSMKQVQWDEDGMTWDVYGASLDPDELSTAIQRHLELQSGKDRESPQPPKRKSKKRTPAKVAKSPVVANIVKVMTPEPSLPAMGDTATSVVESQTEVMPEAEGEKELEKESGKKEETADVGGTSKAEGDVEKDFEGEEEEVYGEEGARNLKSSSHGSGRSQKKSVMRSLTPRWCGSSRKANK